jgi:hypothetical protein
MFPGFSRAQSRDRFLSHRPPKSALICGTVAEDPRQLRRTVVLSNGRSELRTCYPLNLCNIIVSISEYEKRAPQMTASCMAVASSRSS